MENVIIYLIKSSALLLLFLATYLLLLKNETFFNSNRWFLMLGIFCSALLPLLSFQKIVWIEAVAKVNNTIKVDATSAVVKVIPSTATLSYPIENIVAIIYVLGILIFLIQILLELYSLRGITNNSTKRKLDGFVFIEVDHAISPFSFFNRIVYNPTLFKEEELINIIEHEKIHAAQAHSFDVLLARFYCILFWWNPLVWSYKKAIIQNLEFIADQNAISQVEDKKSYLHTLLKITTANQHVAISNHFYQSLIKKRIVMLNTNQSQKSRSWKYFVVLPALAFFMLSYQVKVVAQVRESKNTNSQKESVSWPDVNYEIELQWNKDTKDAQFISDAKILEKIGVIFKASKIKRNKNGEITSIKLSIKDNSGHEQKKQISGSEPINPISFIKKADSEGVISFDLRERDINNNNLAEENNDESVVIEMAFEYPEAPTPPTPPNYPEPPVMPEFPIAPTAPRNTNDKKAWNDFESKMKIFKEKMDSDEMKKFNLDTQKYATAIAAMNFETSDFQQKMAEFEKKMIVFDKEVKIITNKVLKETESLRRDNKE